MYRNYIVGSIFFIWSGLAGQSLPELTFQNIDIWSDRYGAIQILEDSEGYLWMTSAMGVHRYDGIEVHSYFQQTDSLSLSGNYTEMLFEDRQGNIWVGTTQGGIDLYRRELDHFIRVISPGKGIGHAVRMLQDAGGMLWIAGANGLFSFDAQSNTLTKFTPDSPPKDKRGYGFRGLAQDRRDMQGLWVAGLDGAYRFDKTMHRFESLSVSERPGGLYMLMDIHHMVDNQLWCGTWFGGLMIYDLTSKEWVNYYPENPGDGRWHDVIKAIYPKDKKQVWVAGGAGFGTFDRSSESFMFYPFTPNVQNAIDSSFSYAGVCTTKQGGLAVTRLTGFSISSALTYPNEQLIFPPVIQTIVIEGKHVVSDTVEAHLRYVYLNEQEKNIDVNLITPGNYSSKPIYLEYRMEGFDRDWQQLGDGHSARYTNLPQGKYHFQYRARISDQEWIYGRALSIEKAVFFYLRPWFYLLAAGIIAALVYFFYRLRVERIRNEEKLKTEFNKKLADIEMAALRSQMNPHFMFNSLNSIKYYILNEETEQANKYLTKFSRLMRLVLKNSQSKLVSLSDELEALRLYIELESLRFKENFSYQIKVGESVDPEDTYVPPLIVQPYIENAIWHGLLQKNAPGKLELVIEKRNGFIHIEVTDDGIGREAAEALRSKSATKKSFGTKITRDRIALVREIIGIQASVTTHDLHNSDGSPGGTRVTIEIPLITSDKIDQLNLN